jgi:glucuronate isomerase
LGEACEITIADYASFLSSLENRVSFFHEVGCRVSDHALDEVAYRETSEEEVAAIFAKALSGSRVSLEDEKKYKMYTLVFLGKLYSERGWVMQYHINASRNNNSRMFGQLGPDTGYDSINDSPVAYPLMKLMNALDVSNQLPKTIVYSLNPKDQYVLGTMMGSFQSGGIPGKIQLGSAWWFNDTKDGMLEQLRALANLGLLSQFVGMLTDSRSFLSYTRHEYFRRIVCNMLGEWVHNSEAPNDMELLGDMVQRISYYNAQAYFGL